jgi:hypothetical protein
MSELRDRGMHVCPRRIIVMDDEREPVGVGFSSSGGGERQSRLFHRPYLSRTELRDVALPLQPGPMVQPAQRLPPVGRTRPGSDLVRR